MKLYKIRVRLNRENCCNFQSDMRYIDMLAKRLWPRQTACSLTTVVLNLESRPPWRSFAFFLGVTRASDKNIHNYFCTLYFVEEPLFVVAEIIGSPGKNDSLLFHSNIFWVWLWPLQSFERNYDHYSCVWQCTNDFV